MHGAVLRASGSDNMLSTGMSGICSLTMLIYFSLVTTHIFSTGHIVNHQYSVPLFISGLAVPVFLKKVSIFYSLTLGGMLRELSILAIFITANIVTWQERFIHFLAKQYASKHILDILTKIHLVQFTTFQQPKHK